MHASGVWFHQVLKNVMQKFLVEGRMEFSATDDRNVLTITVCDDGVLHHRRQQLLTSVEKHIATAGQSVKSIDY